MIHCILLKDTNPAPVDFNLKPLDWESDILATVLSITCKDEFAVLQGVKGFKGTTMYFTETSNATLKGNHVKELAKLFI